MNRKFVQPGGDIDLGNNFKFFSIDEFRINLYSIPFL